MSNGTNINWKLFDWMLREEWRMHTKLFGGLRFAFFPLLIFILASAAVWAAAAAGTAMQSLYTGIHVLVLFFGLHTGSVGLVGRDAVRNLLGDVTLIVFSARTLPVSKRRLLAIFLVKDGVYYSLLFLLPIAGAFLPAAVVGVGGSVSTLPLLWLTLVATFLLGASITLLFIGLSTRGYAGRIVAVGVLVGVIAGWYVGVDVLAFTPYGLFESVTPLQAVLSLAPIPLVSGLGVYLFDFTSDTAERTGEAKLGRWRELIPGENPGLVAKSLLDVSRSSGGFTKLAFSGGILFIVNAALIELVESFLGVTPSAPISMGAMLGLTAFTSYNWLTQFDDLEEYLIYPVSSEDVFDAKLVGFLLTGLPVGVFYYVLSLIVFDAPLDELVVGFVLLIGFQLYLFGLTVRIAGLRPNEFLFDTVLFALFAGGVGLFLVPVLIIGLVVTPLPVTAMGGLAVVGLITIGIGLGLAKTASPKDSSA